MKEITVRVPQPGELWRNDGSLYSMRNGEYSDIYAMESIDTDDPDRLLEFIGSPLAGGTCRFESIFDGHSGWEFVADDARAYVIARVKEAATKMKAAIIEQSLEAYRVLGVVRDFEGLQ